MRVPYPVVLESLTCTCRSRFLQVLSRFGGVVLTDLILVDWRFICQKGCGHIFIVLRYGSFDVHCSVYLAKWGLWYGAVSHPLGKDAVESWSTSQEKLWPLSLQVVKELWCSFFGLM